MESSLMTKQVWKGRDQGLWLNGGLTLSEILKQKNLLENNITSWKTKQKELILGSEEREDY